MTDGNGISEADEERDVLDAALFRYWIRLASGPGVLRCAKAIAHCVTPAQYRAALIALAREDRLNLPYPNSTTRG